jgi:hypothetical protein
MIGARRAEREHAAPSARVARRVAEAAPVPVRAKLPAAGVLTRGDVLGLQRTIGNLAVQRLLAARAGAPTVQRGLGPSKPKEDGSDEREYADALKTGIAKLDGVLFGASPEKRFDDRYWEKVEDEEYKLALKLKGGVKPSKAVAAIFSQPQRWSFDCAEFVQVANMYATLTVYGAEALDETLEDRPFTLRQHASSLFEEWSPEAWSRGASDEEFSLYKKGARVVTQNESKDGTVPVTHPEPFVLARVPVGSRVMFHNPNGAGTAFENENTVKVGPDAYAAHGIPGKKVFSKAEIVDGLADINIRSELEAGKELIFVKQVEVIAVRS